MPRTTLVPRRRPRSPTPSERVWGSVLLLILVFLVGLFVASRGLPGPTPLPEKAAALPPLSPGGWPWSDVGTYDRDSLFEKINGKADSYLVYDFRRLETASYANPDDADAYVDVYLYDMGTALDAFGIYRAHRGDAPGQAQLGDEGCRSGAAVYFRRGRYYVEITPSRADAAPEALGLAEVLSARLPAATETIEIPDAFPSENLVTVRFDRENGLGLTSLRDAFVAVYQDGTRIALATCETETAAKAVVAEAAETFSFLGEAASFAHAGPKVVGVVGLADDERRRALMERVLASAKRNSR